MHAHLVALDLAQIARRESRAPLDLDLVDAGRGVGRQLVRDGDPHLPPGEALQETRAKLGRGLVCADGRLIDVRGRGSVAGNHSLEVVGQVGIGGSPI